MIRTLIFIGMGSCLGGIARYLLTRWVQGSTSSSFPYGTLAVNLLGCLAIGMLYGRELGAGSPVCRGQSGARYRGGLARRRNRPKPMKGFKENDTNYTNILTHNKSTL